VPGRDELADYERDGFVHLRAAFPADVADRIRDGLWAALPEDRDDPSTWTRPVARLPAIGPGVLEAATSPPLVGAVTQLAGPRARPTPWIGAGTVVRFPVDGDPGDDGWHVDAGFAGPDGAWWVNHRSRGRALLLLVLLSDVGADDAPTRIRVGSHRLVPDRLRPHGDDGLPALAFQPPPEVHDLPLALATGAAGDVYLCHPFLVHAAQRNRGTTVRFLAQPGVPWKPGVAGF